jgi:cytoskeletal protein RodZ
LPSIEFDDDRPPRSRDELLESVRRDGLRRRYRRNGLFGGLALVLVAALAVPVLLRDSGSQRRIAATDQPSTVEDETTTTEAAVVEETTTTVDAAVTTTPGPTTTRPHATTTTIVCRDSYDPRCGPFRWDPDPGANQPATVSITFTPANPKVGEQVIAHIKITDPDGPAGSCSSTVDWGNGQRRNSACLPPPCERRPYGPWTPPARTPDTYEFDDVNTYDTSGTYTVTFTGSDTAAGCVELKNPYSGSKSGSATITISPALI